MIGSGNCEKSGPNRWLRRVRFLGLPGFGRRDPFTAVNESDINLTAVRAELTAVSDRYEAALVANDVPALQELFWESPYVVRFGATENLYGTAEIEAFRRARPAAGLARTIIRREVVTFGTDTGAVSVEFERTAADGSRTRGRQSQFWRRFPEGWRVVSAHVSGMK